MTSSLKFASSLDTTVKSSIGENSEMLLQKIRIRRNREHIRKTFWKDLEERKKLGTSVKCQLKKKGPQHEIYMVEDGLRARYSGLSHPKEAEGADELEKFEGKMNKIFK